MTGHGDRARWWREHLKRWAASGMTREAYCAWHGLSRSAFYRWQRSVRGERAQRRGRTAFESMVWIAVRLAPAEGATPRTAQVCPC